MSEKEKLEKIFNEAKELNLLSIEENKFVDEIIKNAYKQKAVWTVLVALLFYKILNPKQDIRYHKIELKNGFSGRSFDTKIVTPTLRKLGLPAMAESGWLTRSLEQPYPYTLDYRGKIANKNLKKAFLKILDIVENDKTSKNKAKDFLDTLFVKIKEEISFHQIKIIPLKDKDSITINQIIDLLDLHFQTKYYTHGASKLPVIAFYATYQILIKELKRYEKCELKKLGSHTASDRTSKSAGDIEIYRNQKLYEAIEIKLNKEIDINMIKIAYEKIIKFSPKRYSIFSTAQIKQDDKMSIDELIEQIKQEHGCQVIVNGVIPSIKYYLRLVENLNDFLNNYSKLIENDKELKKEHKEIFNKLARKIK